MSARQVAIFTVFFLAAGCGKGSGSSGAGPAPSVTTSAAPAADPRAVVSTLVDTWLDAQNKGRFDDYLALYDQASFQGIRRSVAGGEQKVSFEGWKKDRSSSFLKKPTVAADNRTVTLWTEDPTLGEGVVRVGFTQRWKTARYADHGPKVLRLRVKEGAARIIYEDMLSSAAGWDDEPAKVTLVDGTTLVPPVTVKIVGTSQGGEEKLGALNLVLIDQKKTTRSIEIGSYNGVEAQSYPPEASGAALFKVKVWWAGAGDTFHVIRDGIGVVVKHQWEQEVTGEPGTEGRSEMVDIIRVTLPPGAAVKGIK